MRDLNRLWDLVAEFAIALHGDRLASVSKAIGALKSAQEFDKARSSFGAKIDQARLDELKKAWAAAPSVSPREVGAAFAGAARAAHLSAQQTAVDLVWTGPKTGLIPTRSTEQVLLEVIDSAKTGLFLVSYVFYKTPRVIDALNSAIGRGVQVRILLELSSEHGGAIKGDSAGEMRKRVPGAAIYVWSPASRNRKGEAAAAAVHAKCAVADGCVAFITSANLTSAALERNMELGLLVRGGDVPKRLHAHLDALVTTEVIERWDR